MENGKTLTRLLPTQLADLYQEWFDNARQFRDALAELERLSISIIERDRQARP